LIFRINQHLDKNRNNTLIYENGICSPKLPSMDIQVC